VRDSRRPVLPRSSAPSRREVFLKGTTMGDEPAGRSSGRAVMTQRPRAGAGLAQGDSGMGEWHRAAAAAEVTTRHASAAGSVAGVGVLWAVPPVTDAGNWRAKAGRLISPEPEAPMNATLEILRASIISNDVKWRCTPREAPPGQHGRVAATGPRGWCPLRRRAGRS